MMISDHSSRSTFMRSHTSVLAHPGGVQWGWGQDSVQDNLVYSTPSPPCFYGTGFVIRHNYLGKGWSHPWTVLIKSRAQSDPKFLGAEVFRVPLIGTPSPACFTTLRLSGCSSPSHPLCSNTVSHRRWTLEYLAMRKFHWSCGTDGVPSQHHAGIH